MFLFINAARVSSLYTLSSLNGRHWKLAYWQTRLLCWDASEYLAYIQYRLYRCPTLKDARIWVHHNLTAKLWGSLAQAP